MANALTVVMQSPLQLSALVAEVTLEGGQKKLVLLQDGRFQGEVPAAATWFKLTGLCEGSAEVTSSAQPAELVSYTTAAIEDLFETGVAVPTDGQLALSLIWGVHCHHSMSVATSAPARGDAASSATRGVRFGSAEHMRCADSVGKDDFGETLRCNGVSADFNKDFKFKVGQKDLTFGEIIALAGDYNAHLDALAALEFSWAWPEASDLTTLVDSDYRQWTLVDDEEKITKSILDAVNDKKKEGQASLDTKAHMAYLGVTTAYPLRRYLALASQNFCHFAAQPATGQIDDTVNDALRLYRAYHARALREADVARTKKDRAGLYQALVVDAFGCHFLSDLFATGHMRVPRRLLGERYGVVRGALGMAHDMHCEDNNGGLWLTTRRAMQPRVVWFGYGDDKLLTPAGPSTSAAAPDSVHFQMVKKAVGRSAAEVFAHYCGTTLPEGEHAEDLIPVALPAGTGPQRGDVLPEGKLAGVAQKNSYPLYWWLPERKMLARRLGPPDQGLYTNHDQPRGEQFLLP